MSRSRIDLCFVSENLENNYSIELILLTIEFGINQSGILTRKKKRWKHQESWWFLPLFALLTASFIMKVQQIALFKGFPRLNFFEKKTCSRKWLEWFLYHKSSYSHGYFSKYWRFEFENENIICGEVNQKTIYISLI